MSFLVLLLILGSVYVGSNDTIKQESKSGFFVVLCIIALLTIVLGFLGS